MEKYIYTATQDIDVLLYIVDCNLYENEYVKKVKELAGLYGMSEEDMHDMLKKQNAENSIRQEIMTEKVITTLKEKNEIV